MIIMLFGALSAGVKTYLQCRSDRHALTSAFCNTLPVGCLKFCVSFGDTFLNLAFYHFFQDDRTESSTISHLAHCHAYWSTASQKSDKFYSNHSISDLLQSDLSTWNLE